MQHKAVESRHTHTKKIRRIESSEKTCNYYVYQSFRKSTGILNVTINKPKKKKLGTY
jgi:hypothetical protein